MNPRFPIFIPSKGRFASRMTMRALDHIGVPYRVIVEQQEFASYAQHIDPARLLVLPRRYQLDYDACCSLQPHESRGPGPARNFAWDTSMEEGAAWHWVMDDNIQAFYRLHKNRINNVADGTIFRCMEDFCLRYKNLAMAGPNYEMFVPRRQVVPPFIPNTRIYSCNLIRNDIPFHWRARYNEDTDLSLRILKAGWCTVQFNAFLQKKIGTQRVKGGNTAEFYEKEGTGPKSRMLVQLHPDVARLKWKFGRFHHLVDYRPFAHNKLIRHEGVEVPPGPNEYGMHLKPMRGLKAS